MSLDFIFQLYYESEIGQLRERVDVQEAINQELQVWQGLEVLLTILQLPVSIFETIYFFHFICKYSKLAC